MVETDYVFFRKCYQLGLVRAPLLEIGSAAIQGQGGNICQAARRLGISPTLGVDIAPGPGVDQVVDFSIPPQQFKWPYENAHTAVLFNILEHTFDPICILKNAMGCVYSGGTLLLVVPTVWPLHDFPRDYCRLMPHWFEQFAAKYGLTVVREAFCWLSQFGITPVDELRSGNQYELPSSQNLGKSRPFRYWRSRVGHRLLNTYGRSHWFSHCAIGAAMRMQESR
jgi:hypothetical protein